MGRDTWDFQDLVTVTSSEVVFGKYVHRYPATNFSLLGMHYCIGM